MIRALIILIVLSVLAAFGIRALGNWIAEHGNEQRKEQTI